MRPSLFLLFLLLTLSAVSAEEQKSISQLPYQNLVKENGNKYYWDWPRRSLPHTLQNNDKISRLIGTCLRHVQTVRDIPPHNTSHIEYSGGWQSIDKKFWYFTFSGGKGISDFKRIYIFSLEKNEFIGYFEAPA
jgi:hypothetical protein